MIYRVPDTHPTVKGTVNSQYINWHVFGINNGTITDIITPAAGYKQTVTVNTSGYDMIVFAPHISSAVSTSFMIQ